jgi:uncharacterized protein (DUF1697 family)
MKENQYLVLLRGINVGGNNIIKMTDLKTCFESILFTDVITCIQSGNVLFKSDEKDITKLTGTIEKALDRKFNYKSPIIVIPKKLLKEVVEEAPREFGKDPDNFKYDVIFLRENLVPAEIIKKVNPKEGIDKASAGKYVLYFSRLASKASQSRLSKIITFPEYQFMTIRNWNTTTKLLGLMEA